MDVPSICNFINHAHSLQKFVPAPSKPTYQESTNNQRHVSVHLPFSYFHVHQTSAKTRTFSYQQMASAYNRPFPCISDITIHSPDTLTYMLQRNSIVPNLHFLSQLFSQPIWIHLRVCTLQNHWPIISPWSIFHHGNWERFWFSKHFNQIVSISGLSPEHYSIYSFHIGAATSEYIGRNNQNTRTLVITSIGSYIHKNLNDIHQAKLTSALSNIRWS